MSGSREFDALVARINAANAARPLTPTYLRRHVDVSFGLYLDDPIPPVQVSKDWRDSGVVTAVKDQGQCGSCGSFATGAVIESLLRIRDQNDTTQVDVGFMHACTVLGGDPTKSCLWHADLEVVVQKVANAGYAALQPGSPYPYPEDMCATANLPLMPIGGDRELPGPNAVKNSLMTAPVAAEIYAWEDFTSYHGSPAVFTTTQTGNYSSHAVCIVGFNQYGWIVKNSYGPTWGSKGFAVIAYGTCGLFGGQPAGQPLGQIFALSLP